MNTDAQKDPAFSRPAVFARSLFGLLLAITVSTSLPAAPPDQKDPAEKVNSTIALEQRLRRMDVELEINAERGSLVMNVLLEVEAPGKTALLFELHPDLVVEQARATEGLVFLRRRARGFILETDSPIQGTRSFRLRITGRPRRGGDLAITPAGFHADPDDAWLPVFEDAWAQLAIQAKLPTGWSLVAPGLPLDAEGLRWRRTKPGRTIALAAGPDLAPHTVAQKPVPLILCGPEPDAALIKSWTDTLVPPLRWLSGALGAPSTDSIVLARIPGLPQRKTSGGVLFLPDDFEVSGAPDGAALLAGQWFGERLAGDGAWMKGFAAWQAVEYSKDRRLPQPPMVVADRQAYRELAATRDKPLAALDDTDPAEIARGKGSMVPEMLRLEIGPRRFHQAIQELIRGPVLPRMSLAEFRTRLERTTRHNLERLFQDWFEQRGLPSITAELRVTPTTDDQWRADLTFRQLSGVYSLPVEWVLHGAETDRRETVRIEEEETSLYYVLPFEPRRLELDPLGKLFRTQQTENQTTAR
jgi:hypothetical protein